MIMGTDFIQQNMKNGREVSKFLSERMRAILLNGYEVPGITARYAVSHLVKYDKESGEYQNAGI